MEMNRITHEGVIWFLLALYCLYKDRSNLVALVTVVHLSWHLWRHRRGFVQYPNEQKLWRHVDHTSTNCEYLYKGDAMGIYMSIALVPILFRSMAYGMHQSERQKLQSIALIISLIQIPLWQHVLYPIHQSIRKYSSDLLIIVGGMAFLMFMSSEDTFNQRHQAVVTACIFTWIWLVCLSIFGPGQFSALRGVMSIGEWFVISNLLSFVFSQWVTVLLFINSTSDIDKDSAYAFVASSGVFGCIFACSTVGFVQSFVLEMFPTLPSASIISVLFRVVYLISTAFGIVELCLLYHPGFDEYHNPKFLWWIFGDFLLSVEDSPWKHPFINLNIRSTWLIQFSTTGMSQALQLPRLAWLMYWFLTMTITIPIAPSTGRVIPVIARKWFHFVAVLLFVPATTFAPQLQSLSYAVAISLLLLIESIRFDVAWLNHFYATYLDSNKDETDDATIISHIALVAGCASPLWLVQYFSSYSDIAVVSESDTSTLMQLLGLWGVWVLGIGDSMGAIIGRSYGRLKWGYNHRTIEGSAAMFLCLCATCIVATTLFDSSLIRTDHIRVWLPAVFFVTILEAYTMQIDNIVLPLAGAAVMFSMR